VTVDEEMESSARIHFTTRPVNANTKDKDKSPSGVNKAGELARYKCDKSRHFKANRPDEDE
jgi:hypothetical protein